MNTIQELIDEMGGISPSPELTEINRRYLELWKRKREADDAWHAIAVTRRELMQQELDAHKRSKMKAELLEEIKYERTKP